MNTGVTPVSLSWLSSLLIAGVVHGQPEETPPVDPPDPGLGEQIVQNVRETDYSSFININDIAVWLVIGVFVGAVICPFLTRTNKGMGLIGNMLLGCIGAVLGGVIVELAGIDMDLGEMIVTYEKVIAAMLAAILIVGAFRLLERRKVKKASAKAPQKT